jgi:hypothetical protein
MLGEMTLGSMPSQKISFAISQRKRKLLSKYKFMKKSFKLHIGPCVCGTGSRIPSMKNPRKPFVLRLPLSIHHEAEKLADLEGTSLNQFITLAIAEKLTRIENMQKPQAAQKETPRVVDPEDE